MADIIDELSGMDDAALAKRMGFDDKLADAKTHIAELSKLTGEARTIAADRLKHQFEPRVYPDEWGWIARDAQREAARKNMTPKDVIMDDSPASLGNY